ncbi:MAG: RluA family pseudouridine synthase [Bacteroidota bacterium]
MQQTENTNTELYEHYRFVADTNQGKLRIDKFLVNKIENASRNKIQSAAEAGNILVNEQPVKSNYKVKPNDAITIVMTYPPREIEIIPQNIPVNIIYEDNHIIVLNKEPGMVVHPGYGNYTGTLVNALAWHFKDLPTYQDGTVRPGLVHRIDKNTSGILVVAKTESALNRLARQFYERTINRKYTALVWGNIEEEEGTITGHLGRDLKNRKKMHVFTDGDHGKHAITHYKIIERFNYVTLVECKLETGRTHQIRAHFEYIKHPLFNDPEYGGNSILRGTTFTKYKQFVHNCFKILPRQALHARTLEFQHPDSGKTLLFDTQLPDDMHQVIEKWRQYTQHIFY